MFLGESTVKILVKHFVRNLKSKFIQQSVYFDMEVSKKTMWAKGQQVRKVVLSTFILFYKTKTFVCFRRRG